MVLKKKNDNQRRSVYLFFNNMQEWKKVSILNLEFKFRVLVVNVKVVYNLYVTVIIGIINNFYIVYYKTTFL